MVASAAGVSGDAARVRSRWSRSRNSAAEDSAAVPRRFCCCKSPLFADYGIGIKKDLHVCIGKYFGSDVAAFHYYASACAQFLLTGDHPLTHLGMDGNARCPGGHIGFTHALGHVPPVKQDPGAARCRLQLDAGIVRQFGQRGFIVEGNIPFDGFQRQGAVHGSTLKVGIAELAGEAGRDGALAHAGWSVNSNDEFALRIVVHLRSYELYTQGEHG